MFNQSIKTIKGIGEKKAKAFANLGVSTIEDLMYLYPLRYEDLSVAKSIEALQHDEFAVFLALVEGFEFSHSSRGKDLLRVKLSYNDAKMQALFINSPYIQKILKRGELYWFFGKCSKFGKSMSVVHPEFYSFSEYPSGLGIRPVYPLSRGLKQKDIINALQSCEKLFEALPETLPVKILEKYRLLERVEAIRKIHFPNDLEDLNRAKFRLKFEEIYLLQKEIFENRKLRKTEKRSKFYKKISLGEILSLFPFALTSSQENAIKEIQEDLMGETSMHRLIFGDVGSGKTAIAIASSYLAAKSGYQVAVMAPTEVLAKQHFSDFQKILGNKFKICLLVSAIKEKKKLSEEIAGGIYDIVIGTHALIEEKISFQNLALVLTDEQHRFGVHQRNKLKEKAKGTPDVLSMSATPIPRTLSMVYYGDMDISTLNELPRGRKKIITKFIDGNENKRRFLNFLHERVISGEQAYLLAPRIEDGSDSDKSSVEKMYLYFQKIFPDFKIAELHGRMKAEEKNRIMEEFKHGNIQILVSTTVIEVGVNVPNATIILISNMEQFGLSQLHQLRGRVGRSDKQSYCFLTALNVTEQVLQRAKLMEHCESGFEIAEMDLKMRGPGEVLGNRQHGFRKFKLTDFAKDHDLMTTVHEIFLEMEKREDSDEI